MISISSCWVVLSDIRHLNLSIIKYFAPVIYYTKVLHSFTLVTLGVPCDSENKSSFISSTALPDRSSKYWL